jgi:predicted HAD superfamily Cof-like phosphohydrolase
VDIIVFSVGSMMVSGADVQGSLNEVCAANERKKYEDGKYHFDDKGKITKPPGWQKPDLTPFVGK